MHTQRRMFKYAFEYAYSNAYLNMLCILRGVHISKTHDQHLQACCRGISSCYRQGTILNSHRVIGIATNTSMALNCAIVTYIMMSEDALADAV